MKQLNVLILLVMFFTAIVFPAQGDVDVNDEALSTSSEPIPVLLWSPEKRMNEHDSNLDHIFGANEFHDGYLSSLLKEGPAASVIFLQDKLHADDFTQFADVYSIDGEGGAFANIKNLMEDNFSLEVPRVSSPSESIRQLEEGFDGVRHTVSSLQELEKLALEPGSSFLLIVRLPATADSLNREEALQVNDAIIGEVCKHLSKRQISYSAVFTGVSAAVSQDSEGEAGHHSRHLLSDMTVEQANGTLMNISGTSFLYMRDIYICVKNKGVPGCVSNFTLVPDKDTASTSVVANKTATFNMVFNKVAPGSSSSASAGEYDIKIVAETLHQGDRWVITGMSLFITPENEANNQSNIQNGKLSPGEMDFVVPILYSFHCTEMRMELNTLTNFTSFKGTYVVFNGFQLQPFNIQKDRFFNSVDCVPFFTSAIWMGLFPAILLIGILTYGTLMLLNLSIMDRYDDPKGKTISVHSASE